MIIPDLNILLYAVDRSSVHHRKGREGLCHISKMSNKRINSVNDVLSLNQEVMVKIIEIDKMGRINLSLLLDPPKADTVKKPIGK